MRLLLTGTPGCGKTVLAKKLSSSLGAKFVDVNELILEKKLYSKAPKGEKEAKLKPLQQFLKKTLEKERNVVVDSHLLCEFALPCEVIVVLRCNPLVLKKRLEKRKYPAWKVRENMLAEMLDYCAVKAEENYAKGKIVQVNFTKPKSASAVLKAVKAKKGDEVDWMRLFGKITRAQK